MIQKTHKYTTYPSLRSVRSETFHASLQSFVWGRHATCRLTNHVDQKSTKTSGYHFCDKNYFFLLASKLVFAKTRFVPLKSINCWKSSAFLKPDISAEATTVVPRTVKIWKFKMLYFPNGTRFSSWYSKEFHAILILEFDDVMVKALSCLLRIRLQAVSYFSLQS